MRARSVAIILDHHRQNVVVMLRRRDGRAYATLPGGKIERGETPAEACVREAREETGLEITRLEERCVMENLGRIEHYFLAGSYSGVLELGGPEKEHQRPDNHYEVTWMPVARLHAIDLLPAAARALVEQASQQSP